MPRFVMETPRASGMPVRAAVALALFAVLLVPFFATPIPPLLDFPNHVAEMYVIAHLPTDPILQQVYSLHWTVVANSGVELVMPILLRWLPLWDTGKAFAALSLLLPVLGVILYSRAIFGRWSFWPMAAGLVAYNALFFLGFMNFLIGLGLALCMAAAWIAARQRHPVWTILAAIAGTIILFFVHMFGLLYFALLTGAYELVALVGPPGRRWPGLRAILARLLPDALIFVLPAYLYLTSTLAETTGPTQMLSPLGKLRELANPFLTYYQTPERLLMLALLAVMAALLVTRRARLAAAPVIALLVLLAVWPVAPHEYKATGYIDSRFPIMMGFLLFAGFMPERLSPRLGRALFAAIALVIVLRAGLIAQVWAGHNQDLAELREVIGRIPPGAQVLAADTALDRLAPYSATHRRNWITAAFQKTYYHDPAFLIPYRDAFWPRLFTGLGKQPVVVNPAYADRTAPEGELPDYHELAADAPSAATLVEVPYLPDWQHKFDYVLVFGAGADGDLSRLRPDRLELVEQTPFVALFRVRKDGAK
jgi:hypothetical protein